MNAVLGLKEFKTVYETRVYVPVLFRFGRAGLRQSRPVLELTRSRWWSRLGRQELQRGWKPTRLSGQLHRLRLLVDCCSLTVGHTQR